MKKEKKEETFTYQDLGFPIVLVNCPMKKVFGEWMLDINLADLQLNVLRALTRKTSPLNQDELRFIRKYFELTTTEFGKIFGVTHAAVLKWEGGQSHLNPTTEIVIRLFILDRLSARNEDIGKLYHELHIADLVKKRHSKTEFEPLKIDAKEYLLAS